MKSPDGSRTLARMQRDQRICRAAVPLLLDDYAMTALAQEPGPALRSVMIAGAPRSAGRHDD
jgi:hypothetical protein